MIRMIQSQSSGHAKAYFSDALVKSDYYTSDQELAGSWHGKLAARLGIGGMTDKETFFALSENRHPLSEGSLTPRIKADRTTGYDINFHCPKSVSVLHALAKDDHILKVFEESVKETMHSIEEDSKARIRKGGVYADRATGELVWAQFVHQTARPVQGLSPDPHLHCHCFVFNVTWDDTEKMFKAGQFRDIKRDMPYYQAQFHKTFADKLTDLGYQIRKTEKSFEIEGVPKRVIDLFSKRTDEIGRIAKEKGITNPKELGELGARTRAKKQKSITMAELKQQWKEQINALGKEEGEQEKIVRFAPGKNEKEITAQQCVDFTILHSFERVSVLSDRRLLQSAYRFGLGHSSVSVRDIKERFKDDQRIIHVSEKSGIVCTTKEVLMEEKQMVELARQGQGKMIPLYQFAPDLKIKGQQAAAIVHILTTPHRVSLLRGAAGTGKTTLMKEAVEKINEAGKQVTVVAPSAQASRGVLKEEGFHDADTVAKLLLDTDAQNKLKGQVLWVDEAGLLGTKDMTALLQLVTKQDARIILAGDTRQHASVVRGDALRILNTVAGLRPAEVTKIFRQQNEEYRSAVEYLSKGNIASGFAKLDAMGYIKSIDPMNASIQLAEDYMNVIRRGKSGLIISPTHAQGEDVTKSIRNKLRDEGLIGQKEFDVTRYTNLNLTEAEKMDSRNYEPGQMIQFNQKISGFKRASIWKVKEIEDKEIIITNADDESKTLPTARSNHYTVYQERTIGLSKGDRIRITRNGFDMNDRRLNSGDALQVTSIAKNGAITLRRGKSKQTYQLNRSFGHIADAHCITSYASQGKTVDEVFIYQPAATFPATDAKQFYVSVSRAKERATIYTDQKQELLEHAESLRERQSAIELIKTPDSNIDLLFYLNQQKGKRANNEKKHQPLNPRTVYEPDL